MKIEKLQTAPDWCKRKPRPAKDSLYGFDRLKVGELLTIPKIEQTCAFRSFYVMAMNAAKKYGFTFKCRHCENGDFQVYRKA